MGKNLKRIDKKTMERSFAKKKETGAVGWKRRKLEAEEAKKSSRFFKTFLKKPKLVTLPESLTSSLESDDDANSNTSKSEPKDKSLSGRFEHAGEDVFGEFGEDVGRDVVGDAVGYEGGDVELINEILSIKTALAEVSNAINQHDIGLQ